MTIRPLKRPEEGRNVTDYRFSQPPLQGQVGPAEVRPTTVRGGGGSAEAAGEVGLGGRLVWGGEHLPGRVELHQMSGTARPLEVEERRVVGDPGGLLHV